MNNNLYDIYKVERREHEQWAKERELADVLEAQKRLARASIFSFVLILSCLFILGYFLLNFH